eukprot:9495052-Pyramimonas_sp.AAC.2
MRTDRRRPTNQKPRKQVCARSGFGPAGGDRWTFERWCSPGHADQSQNARRTSSEARRLGTACARVQADYAGGPSSDTIPSNRYNRVYTGTSFPMHCHKSDKHARDSRLR